MNQSNIKVLTKLRRRIRMGVTALDFPTGFAIRSRVSDLRRLGYTIITRQDKTTPLGRYFLRGEPE